MEKKEKTPVLRTMVEVLREAFKKTPWNFTALTFVYFIAGVAPYLTRWSEARLFNGLVSNVGKPISSIFSAIVLLGLATLINRVIWEGQKNFEKKSWFTLVSEFEKDFSKKLTELDLATHEDPTFQDRLQAVREEGGPSSIAGYVEMFVMLLTNVAGIIAAAWIMFAIDWRIFLMICVTSIPMFVINIKYGNTMWSMYQAKSEERRRYYELKSHTGSTTGLREITTFQTAGFFLSRMDEMLRSFFHAQLVEERKRLFYAITASAFSIAAVLASISLLVMRVLAGNMQIGTFIFTISSIGGLAGSINGFMFQLAQMHKKLHIARSFFDILKMTPQITNPENPQILELADSPEIVFENVSFRYPSNDGEENLKNINLTIKPGEKLALVGENGCGKTTLLKLLFRFYDPTGGRILVNGVDLRRIDLDEWYGYLALLAQDYRTYNFPVWELIQLGKLNGGRHQEKISRAANRANATRFIEKWQDKFDQQIGVEFKGVEPSQGQRQKLAIARALYRDALVTILDEPTASVDARAEKEIFDNLEKEMQGQTLVLVSHRFSTIRKADKIVVLEGGEIKEHGNHDSLLNLGGIYAELFNSQAEGYR